VSSETSFGRSMYRQMRTFESDGGTNDVCSMYMVDADQGFGVAPHTASASWGYGSAGPFE